MKPIYVTRSLLPPLQEYIDEIQTLWDTHLLTNMGEKHNRLEAILRCAVDAQNLMLFSSGHLALEATLEAFDLDGEIITTPFTFASTTHAIVRKGLTPVFCDINDIDYTINVNKIESLITSRTSAILPVHVYGHFCDVEAIKRISNKHGLKVIYDAAHAFAVKKDNLGAGNFGDASIFSFHATKLFHSIEGGAVAFSDESLKERFHHIRNFGFSGPEEISYSGGNAKLNEFQSAMGLCNIKYIEKEIAKRALVVQRYRENLSNIPSIILPSHQYGVTPNFSYFPVLFDSITSRDKAFESLKKQYIFARKYFYPIINDSSCYKERFDSLTTPIAKSIANRVITLPMYGDLAMDDVDRICGIITSI